jgi:hypothetical protein
MIQVTIVPAKGQPATQPGEPEPWQQKPQGKKEEIVQ